MKLRSTKAILILATVLFVTVGVVFPHKITKSWVCPISGSTRTESSWIGLFHKHQRSYSALENWISERNPEFTVNWEYVATRKDYLFRKSVDLRTIPEIVDLQLHLHLLVRALDEKIIEDLVVTLEKGSKSERKQKVDAILELISKNQQANKALEEISRSSASQNSSVRRYED